MRLLEQATQRFPQESPISTGRTIPPPPHNCFFAYRLSYATSVFRRQEKVTYRVLQRLAYLQVIEVKAGE